MRISDWSSDVCSSDLAQLELDTAVETLVRRIELELRVDLRAVQRIDLLGQQGLVFLGDDRGGLEIGRASGRERVCKYVSISVAAVYIKKKDRTITTAREQT